MSEPWTRRKLMLEMNRAGWKNNGQPGWYQHQETGALIDIDRYEPQYGCTAARLRGTGASCKRCRRLEARIK